MFEQWSNKYCNMVDREGEESANLRIGGHGYGGMEAAPGYGGQSTILWYTSMYLGTHL